MLVHQAAIMNIAATIACADNGCELTHQPDWLLQHNFLIDMTMDTGLAPSETSFMVHSCSDMLDTTTHVH